MCFDCIITSLSENIIFGMVVSNWVSSGDTLMESTQLHIQGFQTVSQKEVLACSYWSGDYNRAVYFGNRYMVGKRDSSLQTCSSGKESGTALSNGWGNGRF